MNLRFLAKCTHDKPTNRENSSMSFVMRHCPISTTFRNPTSAHNLLNLSCCCDFSTLHNRSSSCVKSSSYNNMFILITLGTNEELNCPPTTVPRSIVIKFKFFTHFCDCPEKNRTDFQQQLSENNFSRFLVGTTLHQQFSTSFALNRLFKMIES